jgi:hypothetical protein
MRRAIRTNDVTVTGRLWFFGSFWSSAELMLRNALASVPTDQRRDSRTANGPTISLVRNRVIVNGHLQSCDAVTPLTLLDHRRQCFKGHYDSGRAAGRNFDKTCDLTRQSRYRHSAFPSDDGLLRRKREEIRPAIIDYEEKLDQAKADLAHVSAAIAIFEGAQEGKAPRPYDDTDRLFARREPMALATQALLDHGPHGQRSC